MEALDSQMTLKIHRELCFLWFLGILDFEKLRAKFWIDVEKREET